MTTKTREVPSNPDAELRAIGCAIAFDSGINFPEMAGLQPDHFSRHCHRVIWSAILARRARGEATDYEAIRDELERTGQYEQDGAADALLRASSYDGDTMQSGARTARRAILECHMGKLTIDHATREVAAGYDRRSHVWRSLQPLRDQIEAVDALLRGEATGEAASASSPALLGVALSDVEIEDFHWLWHGRVALGKITTFDGDGGVGKSLATIDLVARVVMGRAMPDGTPGLDAPAGAVLICGEDGLADTVKPRLLAAGASPEALERVRAINLVPEVLSDGTISQRLLSLLADLPALEATIAATGAKILVIDPISAYLGNGVDMYKDSEVRRVLTPLALMAERADIAVAMTRHLNRGNGAAAQHRGLGSVAFLNVSRLGILFAPNPDAEGEVLVSRYKGNITAPPPTLAYRIVQVGEAENMPRLSWLGQRETSAESALAAQTGAAADGETRSATDEAMDWLRTYLADGPRPAKEVQDAAKADGISEKPLRTARTRICKKPDKEGMRGGWNWELAPAKMSSPSSEGIFGDDSAAGPEFNGPAPKMPTSESNGHLRAENPPKMPSENDGGHLRGSAEIAWPDSPLDDVFAPKMPSHGGKGAFDADADERPPADVADEVTEGMAGPEITVRRPAAQTIRQHCDYCDAERNFYHGNGGMRCVVCDWRAGAPIEGEWGEVEVGDVDPSAA